MGAIKIGVRKKDDVLAYKIILIPNGVIKFKIVSDIIKARDFKKTNDPNFLGIIFHDEKIKSETDYIVEIIEYKLNENGKLKKFAKTPRVVFKSLKSEKLKDMVPAPDIRYSRGYDGTRLYILFDPVAHAKYYKFYLGVKNRPHWSRESSPVICGDHDGQKIYNFDNIKPKKKYVVRYKAYDQYYNVIATSEKAVSSFMSDIKKIKDVPKPILSIERNRLKVRFLKVENAKRYSFFIKSNKDLKWSTKTDPVFIDATPDSDGKISFDLGEKSLDKNWTVRVNAFDEFERIISKSPNGVLILKDKVKVIEVPAPDVEIKNKSMRVSFEKKIDEIVKFQVNVYSGHRSIFETGAKPLIFFTKNGDIYSHIFDDIPLDQNYKVQVIGFDKFDRKISKSIVKEVKLKDLKDANLNDKIPLGVHSKFNTESILLFWDRVDDAQGYEVRRKLVTPGLVAKLSVKGYKSQKSVDLNIGTSANPYVDTDIKELQFELSKAGFKGKDSKKHYSYEVRSVFKDNAGKMTYSNWSAPSTNDITDKSMLLINHNRDHIRIVSQKLTDYLSSEKNNIIDLINEFTSILELLKSNVNLTFKEDEIIIKSFHFIDGSIAHFKETIKITKGKVGEEYVLSFINNFFRKVKDVVVKLDEDIIDHMEGLKKNLEILHSKKKDYNVVAPLLSEIKENISLIEKNMSILKIIAVHCEYVVTLSKIEIRGDGAYISFYDMLSKMERSPDLYNQYKGVIFDSLSAHNDISMIQGAIEIINNPANDAKVFLQHFANVSNNLLKKLSDVLNSG